MGKINVQKLKGFRDFYGVELENRKKVLSVFEKKFKEYGFNPLETPTLEYYELLTDKYGEEEKLVYNFKDFGDRHVAMKYDLTVPTARFFIENRNELKLPWRRYQIQPVWRADNAQRGRYREFYQCDADVIGVKSMIAEVEYIKMGIEILEELGFKNFVVRINNRKILNALAISVGRSDKFSDIVYAIDKWDKRSVEETQKDLVERGLTQDEASKITETIKEIIEADEEEKFVKLRSKLYDIPEGKEGIDELEFIFKNSERSKLSFDLTIARGLSYYTGPIWEWNITDDNIGSVGGSGRYDKLIESLIGESIPATGGSFGIERIIEVMNAKGMFEDKNADKVKVLITIFDKENLDNYLEIIDILRKEGIKVELFPDDKPLKKQFDYANSNQFSHTIVIGEDEIENGKVSLKNMNTGVQDQLSIDEAISVLKNI